MATLTVFLVNILRTAFFNGKRKADDSDSTRLPLPRYSHMRAASARELFGLK
jgi:hypothetical protein